MAVAQTDSDTARSSSASRDLEEGELEDEVDVQATKSPSSPGPVIGAASDAGARVARSEPDGGPWPRVQREAAEHSVTPVAPGTMGALRGAVTSGTGRMPPTAPRAFRHNRAPDVQSTPTAPLELRGRPVGPRDSRRSPTGEGSNHHAVRRDPSPADDARPWKRHKRERKPPVLIVSDPRDVEVAHMREAAQQHERSMDDLQWKLAEAQARLHIHKTRGADREFDFELLDKITKKYYKRNCPESCKANWRLQELSDLSDEESFRDAGGPSPRQPFEREADGNRVEPVPSAGQIYTPHDTAGNDPFCLDDDQLVAADTDILEGDLALKRDVRAELAAKAAGSESKAARDLARQQLVAKTALAESGLRYNYVLLFWQENGRWLPAPVGRFGQPFWKGSAWEDFDPRRLFDEARADHVPATSQKFLELAQDASLISFAFRSATQRHVVSLALQRGVGFVNAAEPDMVSMCRVNPTRLPIAIRRHYRRGAADELFYAEYDAADIANHIILSMSGPQKVQDGLPRRDFHDQKRAWLELLDEFALDWVPTVAKDLLEPSEVAAHVCPWPTSVDLVNRRIGNEELFKRMWSHLGGNGLPLRSLLPGGDCHDYIRRARIMNQARRTLSKTYAERVGGEHPGNQDASRRWIADRLPYEPVPAGLPVVRVRLTKEKVEALAEKYRERRNEKGFIPL